jgi:hypothetical protein
MFKASAPASEKFVVSDVIIIFLTKGFMRGWRYNTGRLSIIGYVVKEKTVQKMFM